MLFKINRISDYYRLFVIVAFGFNLLKIILNQKSKINPNVGVTFLDSLFKIIGIPFEPSDFKGLLSVVSKPVFSAFRLNV